MTDTNIYRCSPRKVREYIIDCIQAGLVPFIQSSPGMGKSTIVKSIFNQFLLYMIDHRLSTSSPEDLSGLPEFYTDANGIRRARFVPFDIFPVEGTALPKGFDGFGLFLDEANAGTRMVQAASYKLVLDRYVGQIPLHERVAIVMAGNLASDRSIVNPLSTAMQSRVIHIEMELNHKEWLEDVALAQNYDPRIIAYLSYKPGYLMDFRPDHDEKTFCCPRTWEFMNNMLKGKSFEPYETQDGIVHPMDGKTALYAGTITSGVAASFVQFCKVQSEIPDIKAILSDPQSAHVPHDSPARWMVVSHLAEQTNDKNFTNLCTYINRFGIEFRVLFFRSVLVRNPMLHQHPGFASAMGELSRYLHGE